MRFERILGISALLIASATAIAPAQASGSMSSPTDGSDLTIRDTDTLPSWNERFQKQMLPLPTTNGMRLASSQGVSTGQASWYGPGFYGNRTASGEVFRPGTLTAAHRTLPFGTKVRVTNLWNGRSTVVRINDRGPFHGGRVIDLAHGAAHQLGLTSSGVADVKLEVLR